MTLKGLFRKEIRMDFLLKDKEILKKLKTDLEEEYNKLKSYKLDLDMSRGKPSSEQLNLSNNLLKVLNIDNKDISKLSESAEGLDYRNYGNLDGILEIKKIFSYILDVPTENIFIGGNSSLSLMFDTISQYMSHGVLNDTPWSKQKNIKFLCPCPGYDRHFAILDYFGIGQIVIPMTPTGPDMDLIEKLVAKDETIKGIFCVPKYSNPTGITYSDATVTRFAKLKPKAKDFRIFWDNAYAIHDIREKPDILLNIMTESKKFNNEDIFITFSSTSKITFAGAGIAAIIASEKNLNNLKEKYKVKTIGFNKINQIAHAIFLKNPDTINKHMQAHRKILEPKFDIVLKHLNKNFQNNNIVKWTNPNGGYFISIELQNASAKRVIELCKNAGLKLTPAGSTYPKGKDILDNNIRIAPSYPSVEELDKAMNIFCICINLATIENSINRLT